LSLKFWLIHFFQIIFDLTSYVLTRKGSSKIWRIIASQFKILKYFYMSRLIYMLLNIYQCDHHCYKDFWYKEFVLSSQNINSKTIVNQEGSPKILENCHIKLRATTQVEFDTTSQSKILKHCVYELHSLIYLKYWTVIVEVRLVSLLQPT
jgi:hypothetical protein